MASSSSSTSVSSSSFSPIGGGGSGIGTAGVGSANGKGSSTSSTSTTTTSGGKGSGGGTPVASSIHGGVITANIRGTTSGTSGTSGGTPVASSIHGGVITANIRGSGGGASSGYLSSSSTSNSVSQAQTVAQNILNSQKETPGKVALVQVAPNVYLTQQAYEVSQRMNPAGVKQVIANAERIAKGQGVALVLGYDPNRGILSTDVSARVPASAITTTELTVEETRLEKDSNVYIKSTLREGDKVIGTYYEKQGVGGMSVRPEYFTAMEKLAEYGGISIMPRQQLSQVQSQQQSQQQQSVEGVRPRLVEGRMYTPAYRDVVAEVGTDKTVTVTGAVAKGGTVSREVIFQGTVKELQQKYPAIAQDVLRSDAYLYSSSIYSISDWSKDIPVFSGTVKGLAETSGIFGKTFTDVVKFAYGYKDKYSVVSDVRIKYSGLEKAASFSDVGYSFGYSIPFIASTVIGTPSRLATGGKYVGGFIEVGKRVATTSATSTAISFGFNVYESIATRSNLNVQKVVSDAYKFTVLTPILTPVAGGAASVTQSIIKPSSVISYTASNVLTGASVGATVSPFVQEAFVGSAKGKPESVMFGTVLGGAIGGLYGGYTLATSKSIERGMVGKVRAGEVTTDTQTTAILSKPYLSSKAVTAGSTFEVSTNVKLGSLRLVADPLSESVGLAVGKNVKNTMFYGFTGGRLQKIPYATTLEYGDRFAVLPLTKQTTTDLIEALERRGAYTTARELRLKSEQTTKAYTEIMATGRYTRGNRIIDVYNVDMAAKLVRAKGSEFNRQTAEKFLSSIRGRAGLYGRSTLEGQVTKDIDVVVYGTFNKEQAKQYLISKAKGVGVKTVENEGALYIGNIKFDVHSSFEGSSIYGDTRSNLLAFGLKKQPVLVRTKYADIVNPAQTIATKASTTSYVYNKNLLTEQRRQKDVLQLRDILGIRETNKSKRTVSSYPSAKVSSVASVFSSQPSSSAKPSSISSSSLSKQSGKSSVVSKSDVLRYNPSNVSKSFDSYVYGKSSVSRGTVSKSSTSVGYSSVSASMRYAGSKKPEGFSLLSLLGQEHASAIRRKPELPSLLLPGAATGSRGKLAEEQAKKYIPSLISIVKGIQTTQQPRLTKLTPYDIRPVVIDKKKPRWL